MKAITKNVSKLIKSAFGFKKLGRFFTIEKNRLKILRKIKSESKSSKDGSFSYQLQNRKELQALLAGPALINDPEVVLLSKYAELASSVIVEIGIAYGGSSLIFLLYKNPKTALYSIDPFIKDSMGEFQASRKKCFGFVSRALRSLGLNDRLMGWNLISDYSFNVINGWTLPIDVIFIDGDHTYEAVKKDFTDWFPFVKKGGYILFHDSCKDLETDKDKYNFGWPGPSMFVNELKSDSRVEIVERVYSITVLRKINE